MLRLSFVAALLATSSAHATVLLGTTAFGTLINDAVTDQGLGGGTGTGTVAGGASFPATTDMSPAGRQAYRYTFTLVQPSNLRVEVGWTNETDFNCLPDFFDCEVQTDQTFVSGIGRVRLDLTRAGGPTQHFDPLATFVPGGLDYSVYGAGYEIDQYDRNASLALQPGSYTLDFTGYGAPGGPAFPGSGGGSEDLNLEAITVLEPATWATMLAGFALTGAALRRRAVIGRA